MRITVFSAACEALFTSGRDRFHCFAWIFAGFDNCTPDSVPASLSGVSCFDGVISIKTPDFSLFSLPITINLDRKAGQPVRLSLHLVPKLQ